MARSRPHRLAVVAAILAAGIALRVWAALAPGSLWFDELPTGLNVRGRGWGELLDPLGYRQVLPVGFVAAEMAGWALLGPDDLGLRLFPLLASIASLVLFWRVATRFLSGSTLYAAVGLFAVSPALVWYARKAKQYAGDVFAALVLLVLALQLLEERPTARGAWIPGVLGGLAILVSQSAVVVAAGLFAVLLFHQLRRREPLLAILPVGILWGLAGLIQVVTTYRLATQETREFMSTAWNFAFFPAPWSSPTALLWLPERLFHFVGFLVGLMRPDTPWEAGFVGVYAILALLGLFYLIRHERSTAALLLTPLVVAILASAVRLMPLSGRLMIYVGPTVLIACLAGLEQVGSVLPRRFRRGITISMVAAPAAFLPFVISTLNRNEDAGAVLRELRQSWRPGDVLYVNSGGSMAMKYYGEPLGIAPWVAGKSTGPDPRAALREVDVLRGHPRAWFIQTHGTGCRIPLIRSYLDTVGVEIHRIEDPHGARGMHEAAASLYDLSDPDRLARSSASTYELFGKEDPRCRTGRSVGASIWSRLRERVAGADG